MHSIPLVTIYSRPIDKLLANKLTGNEEEKGVPHHTEETLKKVGYFEEVRASCVL